MRDMTDQATYAAIRQLFSQIGSQVGDTENEEAVTAADVIAELTKADSDSHPVHTLSSSEFSPTHTAVQELTETVSPWETTYGVDASTTKTLRFTNGLKVGAAAAKMGVRGKTEKKRIERKTTITAVAHMADDKFSLNNIDVDIPDVTANVFTFPYDDHSRQLEDWLMTLSRIHAEGFHARSHVNKISGPLLIDGPIYPSSLITWILTNQTNLSTRNPGTIWPEFVEDVLSYYITTIEEQHRRGRKVIGIVKNAASTQILKTLENLADDKIEKPLPWSSDEELFTAVLQRHEDLPETPVVSYTPWFLHSKRKQRNNSLTMPFKDYSGISLKYSDPKLYQPAMFYVRPPRQKLVLRVEVPYMMVQNQSQRDELQRRILLEIIDTTKEPRAIGRADSMAKISREQREELKRFIKNSTPVNTRNDQRGYNDMDGD